MFVGFILFCVNFYFASIVFRSHCWRCCSLSIEMNFNCLWRFVTSMAVEGENRIINIYCNLTWSVCIYFTSRRVNHLNFVILCHYQHTLCVRASMRSVDCRLQTIHNYDSLYTMILSQRRRPRPMTTMTATTTTTTVAMVMLLSSSNFSHLFLPLLNRLEK